MALGVRTMSVVHSLIASHVLLWAGERLPACNTWLHYLIRSINK